MQQTSQHKHAKTLIYCTQYNIPPHLSLLPASGFRLNIFWPSPTEAPRSQREKII